MKENRHIQFTRPTICAGLGRAVGEVAEVEASEAALVVSLGKAVYANQPAPAAKPEIAAASPVSERAVPAPEAKPRRTR